MIILEGLLVSTKQHKPEQIVTKLRRVEVLVGQGISMITVILRKSPIPEEKSYAVGQVASPPTLNEIPRGI